jgi:hypothetical protein
VSGDGLLQVTRSWRLSRVDTWPWSVLHTKSDEMTWCCIQKPYIHIYGACAGCGGIVRKKTLPVSGDGLLQVTRSWRLSRVDTWPWSVLHAGAEDSYKNSLVRHTNG